MPYTSECGHDHKNYYHDAAMMNFRLSRSTVTVLAIEFDLISCIPQGKGREGKGVHHPVNFMGMEHSTAWYALAVYS